MNDYSITVGDMILSAKTLKGLQEIIELFGLVTPKSVTNVVNLQVVKNEGETNE